MKISQSQLETLNEECCDRIEELLETLGIKYYQNYKRIYGACPVHGGDNISAWNLYIDGETHRGNWVCYTHHCENTYVANIIGFVRGVLSRYSGSTITFVDTIKWILDFLGYKNISQVKGGKKKLRILQLINCAKMYMSKWATSDVENGTEIKFALI